MYKLLFDDGEYIDTVESLEEAIEIKNSIQWSYLNRYAIIYEETPERLKQVIS